MIHKFVIFIIMSKFQSPGLFQGVQLLLNLPFMINKCVIITPKTGCCKTANRYCFPQSIG